MKVFFVLLICCISFSLKAAFIKVSVSNINISKKGYVWIGLYNNEQGFPKTEKAMQAKYIKTTKENIQVVFEDLAPGNYAIIVYHDENSNKKFDANFMHIPQEGYGFSQNPSFFGPPKFNKAKFELKDKSLKININMKY